MRALLTGLLLAPGLLAAQQRTTADARLDAARILVGAPARLTLEVHHRPALGVLRWPQLPDTFNRLEVLQRGRIDTLSDGENVVYQQEVQLTGFDSVQTVVPPLPFSVQPEDGAAYTVTTSPLPLLVSTVPVDTSQPFRPIRDIVAAPAGGRYGFWIFLLAGLLLLGLLVFGIIYLRRNKIARAAARSLQTPLQRLDALQRDGLLQQGQAKEHYTRLADILRDAVALRLRVPMRERPTADILRVATASLPAPATEALRRVLELADAVKFAKAIPSTEADARALAEARQFLTQLSGTP